MEVVDGYFEATPQPFTRHHIDSYDDFLGRRIREYLMSQNPIEHRDSRTDRVIRIWVAGRDGTRMRILEPPFPPHEARMKDLTFAVALQVDLEVDFAGMPRVLPDFTWAELPVPVFSRWGPPGSSECRYDPGGYFIITGGERVLLSQEGLAANMMHVARMTLPDGGEGAYAEVKSGSEDGAVPPRSNRVVVSLASGGRSVQARVVIPGVTDPVPVPLVFRALGFDSDRDILAYMTAGGINRPALLEALLDVVRDRGALAGGHPVWTQNAALDWLRTRLLFNKTQFAAVAAVRSIFLAHVGPNPVRKAFYLGNMVLRAVSVFLGHEEPSDRDHMKFKRLRTTGDLCFELFTDTYRTQRAAFLSRYDTQLTFNAAGFRDAKLVNSLTPENLAYFFEPGQYLFAFERAFKGAWMGANGVSQPLWRTANPGSYAATISHLRKVSLDVPRRAAGRAVRALHGSQWGFMCPIETPDGGDIGILKNLSVLARISTATPTRDVMPFLQEGLVPLETLRPADVTPADVRVWLNGVWIGVHPGPDKLLERLVAARLRGDLPATTSIAWLVLAREFWVWSDAGRLCRPLLGGDAASKMVWIDANETETALIAMPGEYDARRHTHSEIHAMLGYSASTNLVPFLQYNAGTRNMFTVSQARQAIGDYHTCWFSRFDTAAAILLNPERPICRTRLLRWMPLGYGQTVTVAVLTDTAFNMEDSMILNADSVKRGLFGTLYLHTVRHAEAMIDFATRARTTVLNPLVALREQRVPAPKLGAHDYSLLDDQGIIRPGSEVREGLVLVGAVLPDGGDASFVAPRTLHGKVDSVYTWRDAQGLLQIKVKIRELRVPVVGDKLATRQSQKGTIGDICAEADMPFTADGVIPDILFNPHGIPTRMTMAFFWEMLAGAYGVEKGAPVDATGYTGRHSGLLVRNAGRRIFYNGRTGQQITADVYTGPMYYMRTKHMVEDKINYRSTGPMKMSTRQPNQGRAEEGALRVGEMERDVLLAYGAGNVIQDMHARSDAAKFTVDSETGELRWDGDMRVGIPWASHSVVDFMRGMHVDVRVVTSDGDTVPRETDLGGATPEAPAE